MVTTPTNIDENILDFCKKIDATKSPMFLEYYHVGGCIEGDCYGNVENQVEKHGGSIQYGWIIWEDPNVFIEAEFHAVWVDNEGKYVDITPKEDGENKVLFLPDSQRKFTGELVENIRKMLVDTPESRATVRVSQKQFEIRKKYYTGSSQILIPSFEETELKKYALSVLKEEMLAEANKPNNRRNKPCPCGSGKKYKNCHGLGK